MGERTQYTPGTFCWADLGTTDQEAAKAFYSGLFGWQAEDMPVGDESGTTYSMMRLDGKDVAAIAPQPPMQRDAGAPPAWNSYVSVERADAAASRASELGGTVVAPPFDVLEAGRMAVLQDPQGAFFMAWEPRRHFGSALVNAPGAVSWNELVTPDLDGAAEFYGGLFGWTLEPFEGSPQRYLTIRNGEANNGGMREPQPGEPAYWLVYFGIDDIDAGLARAEELGGGRLAGPIDIGMAKIGVVQDPQGAVFALYAGQFEP
jgi:predicted enzyme related to lactoylglutathione lyase